MLKPPKTKEQAREYRYGPSYGPSRYTPTRCAYEVPFARMKAGQQCFFKLGHGPDGLYCKRHAKLLAKEGATT